jgi:hypothetical protein
LALRARSSCFVFFVPSWFNVFSQLPAVDAQGRRIVACLEPEIACIASAGFTLKLRSAA